MRKYKILINNLERVAQFLGVNQDLIKYTDLTHPLASKFSKSLSKHVPLRPDVDLIVNFENKTGLKLSYDIFEKNGSVDVLDRDGYHRGMNSHLDADIIVIDKNYNRGWI